MENGGFFMDIGHITSIETNTRKGSGEIKRQNGASQPKPKKSSTACKQKKVKLLQ